MKTIEQIQDEVAKEFCGVMWEVASVAHDTDSLWPEVCKRYAIEVAKATLEKASENATAFTYLLRGRYSMG